MTSLLRSIDYKSGNITFIEDGLFLEVSILEQLALLREDLLQVEYDSGRSILDVGWYPSFREDGAFQVFVVRDADWSTPIYKVQTTILANLPQVIQDVVDLLEAERAK